MPICQVESRKMPQASFGIPHRYAKHWSVHVVVTVFVAGSSI